MIASRTRAREMGLFDQFKFALRRQMLVLGSAFMVLGLWVTAAVMAPLIEERWFPVVGDVRLSPMRSAEPNAIAFRTIFTKFRNCPTLGQSWFAILGDGTLYRVSPQRPEAAPLQSHRPVGRHTGQLQVLTLPRGTIGFLGTGAYDCDMPWGPSQVTIGPFDLSEWTALRGPPP